MATSRTTQVGNRAIGRSPVNPRSFFASGGWGAHRVYNSFSGGGKGFYKITFLNYTGGGKGFYGVSRNYADGGRGFHRIANDALTRWELYRGVDASPDLDASPWETFTSSPHLTAACAAGHTYHFVLRLRDKYNLLSQNFDEEIVTIDGGGLETYNPPSSPLDVEIEPAAAGAVRVTAIYDYRAAGEYPASTWLVYLTDTGVDPNPAVDTPVEIVMDHQEAVEYLDYTSDAFADGATIKCLVRVRFTVEAVDFDSTNVDVYSTTADTDGPAQPEGGIFFDDDYMQNQAGAATCGE